MSSLRHRHEWSSTADPNERSVVDRTSPIMESQDQDAQRLPGTTRMTDQDYRHPDVNKAMKATTTHDRKTSPIKSTSALLKRVLLWLTIFLIITGILASHLTGLSFINHFRHSQSSNTPDAMGGSDGYRSVAYFVNWAIYGRNYNPQDLPANKLTHVLYAFANVRPETGEVYLTDTWSDTDKHYESDSWNDVGTNMYGCLKQLNLLKRKHRQLKLLMSVGGWTYSSNFASPASTQSGRDTFARSCVDLVKNLGLDGIDIDWEYPNNTTEGANYVALLETVREHLDAYSRQINGAAPYHFELTVASPAGPDKLKMLDLPGMDKYLDFWNLMAYDFAGSWDPKAGHQANLYPSYQNPGATPFSISTAVKYYTSKGVPANKIVLGMPLYGRAFENTDGPGRPYQGVGPGTWEAGVYDFKKLPLAGAGIVHDGEAGASFCYNPASSTMVSFDDWEISRQKTDWIKMNGLGGAMWWESSGDRTGDQSLMTIVSDKLGSLDRRNNCLEYPQSKYDNLKKGFQ